jgi:taurine dioxygenase
MNATALTGGAPTGAASATGRPFEVRPLHPALGAEIVGITLADAVGAEMFAKVYEVFLEYKLILFRDVDLPPATQVAFARRFGEVQVHVMNQYHGYADHPEIYLLTNLDEQGRPNGKHPDLGTVHWHTDGSWRPTTGHATMMYAEMVPSEGGETLFADMYGAYDNLSDTWKARLAGMKAVHNLDFSRTRRHGHDPMTEAQRAAVPPVAHPVVRIHPETGRKALFLGDHAEQVEGMDYEAGRALIEELNALATPDHLVYRHVWSPRECVVWDNRCLLHRATLYDTAKQRRVMRRCTVLGDRPY